jgi:hypothetical protein
LICYHFQFETGPGHKFVLDEESETSDEAELAVVEPWLALENFQCECCTIRANARRTCPAALSIVPLVKAFGGRISYESIKVTVERAEVKMSALTSVQQGLRSLAGLLLALSACPVMCHLRPMAYFHLPFGDTKSTVFRALGMYLTGQYLRSRQGKEPDWELKGLLHLYDMIHEVNINLASRIRMASENDATVNCVIMLDIFGYEVETSLREDLAELKPLFAAYLEDK